MRKYLATYQVSCVLLGEDYITADDALAQARTIVEATGFAVDRLVGCRELELDEKTGLVFDKALSEAIN